MAKIAEALTDGRLTARAVAGGDGWSVEEQHAAIRVALVVAGTFQYRTTRAPELMVPGALRRRPFCRA